MPTKNIFDTFHTEYCERTADEMSFQEYLDLCKDNKLAYATAAERMVKAIGEPEIIDTSKDPKLSRIFLNRSLRIYKPFEDFYGMEDTVERLVGFFVHAAQGLEERKQILYLLGPVGGGKCHRRGTKIYMSDGSLKNIEDIEVGDELISITNNLHAIARKVSETFVTEPKQVVRLVTKEGLVVECAATHRFLTDTGWKRICELENNEFIATLFKSNFDCEDNVYWDRVKSVTYLDSIEIMYDIEVEGFHNYIANGIVSHNSSVAERLKQLMEIYPIYVLKAGDNLSPIFELPLGLFSPERHSNLLFNKYGIEKRYLTGLISPWAVKRLHEFGGDISKFRVVKLMPSKLEQISIVKTEPGDDNNQDISSLVGKTNIRMLEFYDQNDTDCYSYSGALCKGNQGMMEFVEMFKCVEKGTKISLFNGMLKNIEDIVVGDEVLSLNENTLKTTMDVVSRIWETDKKEVYDLRTKRGLNFRAAGTHPVLTNNGWKRMQDISQEDFIANIRDNSGLNKTVYSDIYIDSGWGTAVQGVSNFREKPTRFSCGCCHWDQVESIIATGKQVEMYDIEVKNNHNYIANGIISHNSPIKTLHPLLTATQEGNYMGTEGLSAIPFSGIIVSHSNLTEYMSFKTNKNNEAFLDRIYPIKVPYCLRVDDEIKIYEKMLQESSLHTSPCAPETLRLLARFSVLTRLREHENSNIYSKLRVYNGENIKDVDPKAKSIQEYRDAAGIDEGIEGSSTRFAFKVLSNTFNFDPAEIAADPVHLMFILEESVRREQLGKETETKQLGFIKEYLSAKYAEFIGNEIQKAYIESYSDYGQNLFDRYVTYADHWIQEIDYKDPDTGNLFDRSVLNTELEKIEKPAQIANPKDFRHEIVNFVLRARAKNNGENPKWNSYRKLCDVIEKKMFASTEELLPIVSFGTKSNKEDQKKHDQFIARMIEKGYTRIQCKRLVEWYQRVQKSA